MSSDNKASIDYLIALLPEQSERLKRAADSGAVPGTINDIIIEAIDKHLTRIERQASKKQDARPERSVTLFQYLFGGHAEKAFERLSEGVIAMLDNAAGLLEDASVLADAKRYERAEFLIATAQEEMGKAYILLDMCRIDLARRHVLRHLCSSFYSHVIKHVYFELSGNKYAVIWELPEVQHHFRISAREWWPSSPESGEPDMPHDTFFLREANLYVDVDSYAGVWMVPRFPSKALMFEMPFLGTPIEDAQQALGKLRAAQESRLLSPEALHVFNGAMKGLVVSEQTSLEQLRDAYERAGTELEARLGIPPETLKESTLHNWPMYWIRR